jgi:type III restriction enzyme
VTIANCSRQASEQRYYFKFIFPESYDLFFQVLREGKYQDFTSTLEADLARE